VSSLAGLERDDQLLLVKRAQSALKTLMEHEATIKATSYDNDKAKGHYGSRIPAGVLLDDGELPPPYWVSPYHHFKRRLARAESPFEFTQILHMAEKKADELRVPGSKTTAIGGTNWEEVEFSLLEQGYGASAGKIAEEFGISIELVKQIREENDHDPQTGEYRGENRFIVEKVLEYHFVDNLSVDTIAPIVRKSRATVYRYIKESVKAQRA
jgi:hypothetical protein